MRWSCRSVRLGKPGALWPSHAAAVKTARGGAPVERPAAPPAASGLLRQARAVRLGILTHLDVADVERRIGLDRAGHDAVVAAVEEGLAVGSDGADCRLGIGRSVDVVADLDAERVVV